MTLDVILKLAGAALLPVLASAILYLLNHKTNFGKLNFWVKQTIYGVVFGAIAVFGTEFGIKALGVTINVRDAAPICAGLFFGWPAGIIAGLIGGIERFFAAYWGAGTYTQIACTVATIFSGCFAAWQRKFMFGNRRPAWYYGLSAGVVCETIHMLLVFVTNMSGDMHKAFTIVQKCTVPMVGAVAISVFLAGIVLTILAKEKLHQPLKEVKLVQTMQKRLLVVIVIAYLITSVFTFLLESQVSKNDTFNTLTLNIEDVKNDITDASDENLIKLAYEVEDEIHKYYKMDHDKMAAIATKYGIAEVNLIGRDGIIYESSEEKFYGFDMNSGAQSAEFTAMFETGQTELTQAYQPTTYNPSVSRKYGAIILRNGDMLQIGYDSIGFQADIKQNVTGVTRNRHIGTDGGLIITNNDLSIVSDGRGNEGKHLASTGLEFDRKKTPQGEVFEAMVYDTECYCMFALNEGYYIIGILPVSEAAFARDMAVYMITFMEILIFTALFIMIYFLIKLLVVRSLRKVNSSLAKITEGDLEEKVDVRTSTEFDRLSNDINTTVDALKDYIAEAAARIDKELEFAKSIQESALPRVFPPFPEKIEFDIWAGMWTAKEVGGDFYDFYLIGENKLAFLIADVSGKGVPAAMFMMTSKTMLKNLAESGLEVNEAVTRANAQLCENNDAGMFVTAWMGILDLKTGHVEFANAGHNPPVIRRKDGSFEYLHSRAGFVLAGMDGVHYRKNELDLEPGDTIYLYTDGVTEATNATPELFGEDRLLNSLNKFGNDADMKELCCSVKADVDEFVAEAPQFDDITMVGLTYKGRWRIGAVTEITVDAEVANVTPVTEFVEETLEGFDFPMKAVIQINVAIDEIFSNIALYAYAPGKGEATIKIEELTLPRGVRISFIDSGKPFNPLESSDPDITLSAEERDIGGLGIYMVKKSMNEVSYEYKDGKNILSIVKYI